MYNQREVVLIPFPFSDLSLAKKRPALIISNDKLNNMQDRICCLVTSKLHKDDLVIRKEDFELGNLPFKSSIKTHRLFSIDEKIIIKRLCKIKSNLHKKVITKLNSYIE